MHNVGLISELPFIPLMLEKHHTKCRTNMKLAATPLLSFRLSLLSSLHIKICTRVGINQPARFRYFIQGSYRQVCVKFKDFSRASKRLSYCFQGLKTKEKY